MRLLGSFEVRVDGQPLAPKHSRKEHLLLALLALRPNRPVERDWLEEILWGENSPIEAEDYFRHVLSAVRKSLGSERTRLQSPSNHTLLLDLTQADVDLLTFDNAVVSKDMAAQEQAVSLYCGPLLEGWSEEWVLSERRAREAAFLTALDFLANTALSEHQPSRAVGYLRRCVATDPFREGAYAALMKALGACGDYAEVTRVYRNLRQILHRELNVAPSAETQVFYTQLMAQSKKSPFPLPVLTSPRRKLPVPATSLIGREYDIECVLGCYQQGRMVTLTGTGGVGKTRLAITIAEALEQDCADGVWFVELATLSDSGLVPQTVAQVFNIRESPERSIEEALVQLFASRSLLLIIDNCEHVLDACAQLLTYLLTQCPTLRVLATSRQSLCVAEERVYQVSPLGLPSAHLLTRTPTSDKNVIFDLLRYAGPQLFIERAKARKTAFHVTATQAVAIANICHRLDGLPLAIELAAARVISLSVEEINTRLDNRFHLLTGGNRTAHTRHKTMRAAIDWSYELLTEAERKMLYRLSVFRGGWTLKAAEAVVTDEDMEEWSALDLLTSLTDKSLVVAEPQEGHTRYRLLETIRQYAHEHLIESGEGAAVCERHQAFYMALAEEASSLLAGPQQTACLHRLESEHDNLRAVLEWSSARLSLEQDDKEVVLRVAGALYPFWLVRGYFTEGRKWLTDALASTFPQVRTRTRAKALIVAGAMARMQGDYAEAHVSVEQSLTLFQELEDKTGYSRSLLHLGLIAHAQGNYALAYPLFEQSLAICQELEDKQGIARCFMGLGKVALVQGDYVAAQLSLEQSLAIREELEDKQGVALSFLNLGVVALCRGDYPLAHSLLEQSLIIHQELEDKLGIAYSLEGFARLALVRDEPEKAAFLWGVEEAVREAMSIPFPPSERTRHEQQVIQAHNAMGQPAFAAAWAHGRTLTWEQAIRIALKAK